VAKGKSEIATRHTLGRLAELDGSAKRLFMGQGFKALKQMPAAPAPGAIFLKILCSCADLPNLELFTLKAFFIIWGCGKSAFKSNSFMKWLYKTTLSHIRLYCLIFLTIHQGNRIKDNCSLCVTRKWVGSVLIWLL
jgi:hypothetical protein